MRRKERCALLCGNVEGVDEAAARPRQLVLSVKAGVFFKYTFRIKLGGVFAIYELLPAFIVSCIFIVAFSLLTKKPSSEVEEDFEAAKVGEIE